MSKNKNTKQKSESRPSFGTSLEKYVYQAVGSLHIPWAWMGIAIVVIVVGMSIKEGYWQSTPLFGNLADIIEESTKLGDYETARMLNVHQTQMTNAQMVLGVDSDLGQSIFPEREIEAALMTNSRLMEKYPGDKTLMLRQAELLEETGDTESADYFREQVRILDPSNSR